MYKITRSKVMIVDLSVVTQFLNKIVFFFSLFRVIFPLCVCVCAYCLCMCVWMPTPSFKSNVFVCLFSPSS